MCIASPILVTGSINGRDLLIFIFILKTTGTFTPVHSVGYLILDNEFRATHEVARQNIQVHEKYKKYIFRIIFYVSVIKNNKQTKKGIEINMFKSLARANVL
jgi:uncharacterized membrane protein